ncbi:hypothetical protein GGR54DRAFT_97893 [Hypoxylon sp. NC1633]|nr:hypothetical protein GGR54DRAFT_97893 [Hypoxylon sp. NC1633]
MTRLYQKYPTVLFLPMLCALDGWKPGLSPTLCSEPLKAFITLWPTQCSLVYGKYYQNAWRDGDHCAGQGANLTPPGTTRLMGRSGRCKM